MKRGGLLLIIIGALLALLSGAGVYSVLQQRTVQPTPTPIPTVKVVVATQNIAERTVIQANMVTLKDWPQDLVPLGALTKTQDAVGKITSVALVPGEPVLMSRISMEQEKIGLAPMLPPGLVAVVLSLSPVSSVGGAMREGDTVDILVSTEYLLYNEQGDESKPLYATFYTIQDVPVLRVVGQGDIAAAASGVALTSGARTQSTTPGPIMVTVLVTPQDALLLKYVREKGTIDLALRSPQFHDQVITDPVYLDYIIRRFELPRPLLIKRQTSTTKEGSEE